MGGGGGGKEAVEEGGEPEQAQHAHDLVRLDHRRIRRHRGVAHRYDQRDLRPTSAVMADLSFVGVLPQL